MCAYDKNYYQNLRQKIQEKFNKAQAKWFQMAEMLGREYISFTERAVELNQELLELNKKEEESKKEETLKEAEKVNKKKTT